MRIEERCCGLDGWGDISEKEDTRLCWLGKKGGRIGSRGGKGISYMVTMKTLLLQVSSLPLLATMRSGEVNIPEDEICNHRITCSNGLQAASNIYHSIETRNVHS